MPVATITRPANVTAYTAGDVVGGAFEITGIGERLSDILITDVRLALYVASLPAGMTTFSLELYNATPPSAIVDNAPWTLLTGDRAAHIGSILINTPGAKAGTLVVEQPIINKGIELGNSTSVFGYLVTTAGYTPAANSEVYTVGLVGVQL